MLSEWKTIPEEELIQIYTTYQRGYYEDDFRNYFKAVEARLRELNTAPTNTEVVE